MSEDDLVFKALADPTRRFVLDRLFARDGRTLGELEAEVDMTRFGVMKHLRVLEDAGLVVTQRSGREKLHFLNPVPIRLIHDRWIDKYTERRVSALTELKAQLEDHPMSSSNTQTQAETRTVQVYRVYIKATAQAIWDAITTAEWSDRYGYKGAVHYDLKPGGAYRHHASDELKQYGAPDVVTDGEVIEADPPHRLVQTWRMLMDPETMAEGFTRVTFEITEGAGGVSTLTVSHDVTGAPRIAAMINGEVGAEEGGGGWAWIFSDLKTLLETGTAMAS